MRETSRKKKQGFTLIELMIVVAIVGIIAAVAIPSYQNSVKKSRRSDVQGALMGFANAMERHFTANGTYEGAAAGEADTGTPAIFPSQSPIGGGAAFYNLTISAATASTYTLNAEATGAQNGDGDLQLDNTGARRWDEGDDGYNATTDQNWDAG